jgi:NADPH:quinone reductase
VIYMARGSFAEYTLSKFKDIYKIDKSLLKEGTAFLMQGMTAACLIEKVHKPKSGEWVLVPAAAGGTGALICQAAKEKGAKVIGTASTKEKCDKARKYCDFVINYSKECGDFSKQVMEITNGIGVNVIYDGVGKATFSSSLSSLKPNGILVSFGAASGTANLVDSPIEGKKILQGHLFNYTKTSKDFMELASLTFKPGWIKKVNIFKVYEMKEIGKAESDLENRISNGKVLIGIQ